MNFLIPFKLFESVFSDKDVFNDIRLVLYDVIDEYGFDEYDVNEYDDDFPDDQFLFKLEKHKNLFSKFQCSITFLTPMSLSKEELRNIYDKIHISSKRLESMGYRIVESIIGNRDKLVKISIVEDVQNNSMFES